MKKQIKAISILFFLLTVSCGPPPEWKQKEFESEIEFNKYISDSISQEKWRTDDSKFIETWEHSKSIISDVTKTLKMEIMENGYGKFTETQGAKNRAPTFRRDDTFNWSKIDDVTIEITNLQGPVEYRGGYRFTRFNGEYEISYSSKNAIKNLKTGQVFRK